jgi:hypothetical protein
MAYIIYYLLNASWVKKWMNIYKTVVLFDKSHNIFGIMFFTFKNKYLGISSFRFKGFFQNELKKIGVSI